MVRYTKRITPDETNSVYIDGDFINYTLPQNIIDLSSVNKYYTASIDSVEKYDDDTILKRFLPTNPASIIDYIQIKKDGEILQTIPEYALLQQIYTDLNDNENKNSDGDKNDTISYNTLDNNNYEISTHDFFNTTELYSYNYCISKWIGFFNGNSRYLDCRGKHIQITIRLSPKYITYRGLKINDLTSAVAETYPEDYHYRITNCFMNMTIVDGENLQLDNNIVFKDFTHFKSMKNTKSKNMIVKGRTTKNIDHIIATCTDPLRNTDTGLQLQNYNENENKFGFNVLLEYDNVDYLTEINDGKVLFPSNSTNLSKILNNPNQLNNSIYFKRNGIDIKTNQFKVNGIEITPPYGVLETFNNVKTIFNTNLKKVSNLASFINDFFISAHELKKTTNTITEVEWIILGDNKNIGGEGHIFLVHNASIQF